MVDSSSSVRWAPHALSAMLLRTLSLAVPVAASVAVAIGMAALLPGADTVGAFVWQALVVIVPSTATLWVVDRLARRFLPLAALLRLSLAFPDQAPSRYAVARLTNSTRELQRRIDEARAKGVTDDPTEAAKVILALVAALSLHDRRTRGHSERVRLYTDLLAEELRLSDGERDRLRWAALVHDIGKLRVPSRVLNKAGKPNEQEWEVLRSHPEEGERLCAALMPWLGQPGKAIVEHHKRFDGAGYPAGLRGHEISLYGRVLSVADAFEVMTAARAYKRPKSAVEARAELSRCAGSQFDPAVVRAFLGISLGRLRLAMGPLSWLAQWPVLAHLPNIGKAATQVSGTVAGAAALSTSQLLAPTAADGSVPTAPLDPRMGMHEPSSPDEEDSTRSDSVPRSELAPDEADLRAPNVVESSADEPAGPDDRAASGDDVGAAESAESGDSDRRSGPGSSPDSTDADPSPEARDPAEDEPAPDTRGPRPGSDVADDDRRLPDTVERITDDLTDTVDDLGDGLTDTVDDLADDLTDTVDDLADGLTDTTDDVVDGLTDTVRDAGDAIPEPTGDTTDNVADVVDSASGALTGTTDGLTDAATDSIDDVTDGLTDTVDDVTGGLLGR